MKMNPPFRKCFGQRFCASFRKSERRNLDAWPKRHVHTNSISAAIAQEKSFQGACITVPLAHDLDYYRSMGISNTTGCYAVFNLNDECLYVGRSKNLLSRIFAHWRYDDNQLRKWVCTGGDYWGEVEAPHAAAGCPLRVWFCEDYKAWERHLIRTLQPKFNVKKRVRQSWRKPLT